jgi:hypothetical protein
MTTTIALKHVRLDTPQRCSGCGASLIAVEDSGSRVFSVIDEEEGDYSALLCGGCYSRLTHGTAITLKSRLPPP